MTNLLSGVPARTQLIIRGYNLRLFSDIPSASSPYSYNVLTGPLQMLLLTS